MVIIICSFGLSLSTAILVATVIPISATIGFIPLDFFGIDLNQITIVALIIVLGILVDDAIVLNDNIERRLYNGDTPRIAGLEGTREVFVSLTTASLATVSAFFPLFFMQGNIGNFIKPLPVVITVMMFSSLLVSITVIPILRQWISERFKGKGERKNRKQAGLLGRLIHKLSLIYEIQIHKFIKRPLLTALVALLLGTSSYAVLPFLGVQFFPKAERDVFLIDFKLPADSSIERTNDILSQAADWILDKEGVDVVTAYIGRNTPKFYYSEQLAYGDNIGQLFVKINKNEVNTTELLQPIREELQAQFSDVEIIPRELEQGPPVGAPIVVRVIGEDLTKLNEVSQQVKQVLKEIDGAVNISDDMGANIQVVSINPNQEKLTASAVSEKDLSMTIRLISEGIKVADLNQDKQLYEVVLRVDNSLFDDTESAIRNLYVPSAKGIPVAASELVTVERKEAIKSIQRENYNRIVNVRSYTDGRLPDEILSELKEKLDSIQLPAGYEIQFGGENEHRVEAFHSVAKLWIVVLMIIYILMVWQFNSFMIPFIILTTVYLAFGGSLIGLFITNSPLGFMALMGAVSLSGIVVRNGVILIEFIQQERRQGHSLYDAVSKAGKVRLRPILLTSFTAVGALLPLAFSGGSLFQPMAISIISGLLYSTFLTLIVVPALYVLVTNWFEKSNKETVILDKKAI